MADLLFWLAAGGVMVGVLVVVHEAGHWIVAKLFGVGTPVFSIGFGPRIFGFRLWETDFRISVLPVGGYVRMAGADPFGEEFAEDEVVNPEEDFMTKPVWQRFLIMLAGPAANLILPFVLFSGVLMLGEPQPDAVIGDVRPGSMAAELGLEPGDEITQINDTPIDNWRELGLAISSVEGPFRLSVKRDEQPITVQFPEWTSDRLGRRLEGVGLSHSSPSATIGVTDATSPAWQSGLRPGDRIVKVDESEIVTYTELIDALTPGQAHTIDVERRIPEKEPHRVAGLDDLPKKRTLTLTPDPTWSPSATEAHRNAWGLVPINVFVGRVQPESAADKAGVRRGDRLMAIDGAQVQTWEDVLEYVGRTVEGMNVEADPPRGGCVSAEKKVFGNPLELSLVRDGKPVTLTFAPTVEQETRLDGTIAFRPIMGVSQFRGSYAAGGEMVKYYGALQAVSRAGEEGRLVLETTMNSLGNLLTGRAKFEDSVGGPVEIIRSAGYAAKQGMFKFARLMGIISFSLGIVNLLPIPVLDGGQILFYAIEGIRGRPLPLVLRERIQMVGVLFLASLMVVVLVLDIGRWIQG
ncbi:MAG: RIP metalloprotease RseP [Myxococcota bacterium]